MNPEIQTVYEDEWLKIVNKPANLIVHHSKYVGPIDKVSLCQLVNNENQSENYHPIHRLDRKTSDLIIFSKKKDLIAELQNLFNQQLITKTYIALVRGYVQGSGLLDDPIRADKMSIYKEAKTHYESLHQFEVPIEVPPYSTARYSILCLTPKTGRMHQLRKHMNKFSHPIIGDPKYGNRHHNHMFIDHLSIPNLFLHAQSLSFKHPVSDETVNVKAPFPDFWNDMLKALKVQFELPE